MTGTTDYPKNAQLHPANDLLVVMHLHDFSVEVGRQDGCGTNFGNHNKARLPKTEFSGTHSEGMLKVATMTAFACVAQKVAAEFRVK